MREIEAILRAPAFQRSPSLSKLLGYLVSREVAGDGRPTQFDIAIEALGKDESFDESTDSAVRVQMSRLRNALRDYYLVHQPHDGMYVHFRPGDYKLRSASLELAYPEIAAAQASQAKAEIDKSVGERKSEKVLSPPAETSALSMSDVHIQPLGSELVRGLAKSWKGVSIALALAAVAAYFPFQSTGEVSATAVVTERGLEVPFVALDVQTVSFGERTAKSDSLFAKIENDLTELLRKSMISRVTESSSRAHPDYKISVEIEALNDERWDAHLVLLDRQDRVVTERAVRSTSSAFELAERLSDHVTSIVSPAGHITRDLAAKVDGDPKNDFECFLVTEGARASGNDAHGTLNDCVRHFRDGEYTPYLKIRQAFYEAQKTSLSGRKFQPSEPAWRATSQVLADHPENPYANTLAAKLLVGRGDCTDASHFGREGFSRGRTYPALELAVIVDAFECRAIAKFQPFWRERIARITKANPDPHTLLKSYILLGLLVSEQEHLIEYQKAPVFELALDEPLTKFNLALRAALNGVATKEEQDLIRATLPALLFSSETRDAILNRIQQRNKQVAG